MRKVLKIFYYLDKNLKTCKECYIWVRKKDKELENYFNDMNPVLHNIDLGYFGYMTFYNRATVIIKDIPSCSYIMIRGKNMGNRCDQQILNDGSPGSNKFCKNCLKKTVVKRLNENITNIIKTVSLINYNKSCFVDHYIERIIYYTKEKSSNYREITCRMFGFLWSLNASIKYKHIRNTYFTERLNSNKNE